ncbi:unnamed protein product [Peronospora destructor]|uniref:MtN3-like protein n=1 Tax=Peronospora destructor TaxID=86335 RepID=A0AAV0TUY9_9STRA|nr:unnamed protein product [Peronospora destructor]
MGSPSSALVTLLHMTAAAIQIGMNFSPAPDMYQVHKFKTTDQMALLPLVLMCFNNHLWLLYGLLTGNIFPLCAAALVGEIAGVVFTSIYYHWARNTLETRRTCAAALFGMALVTMYVLLGVSGKTDQTFDQIVQSLGYVGATINICMYASPLATIKVVLETKSSASLPINLCVMIFFNCCGSYVYCGRRRVRVGPKCHRPRLQRRPATAVLHLPTVGRTVELDTKHVLPTTYQFVCPSRVARFAGYQYQRAEGTPVMMADDYDYDMQPLLMTPISV